MKLVDNLLNRITMYRFVTYVLVFITGVAIFMSLIGQISYSPTSMVGSLATLLISSYIGNVIFRRVWNVPTNMETWLITALILFLIVRPATSNPTYVAVALIGFVSSISKFLVAWRGRHIFNPAAFAVTVIGLATDTGAAWWVGSSALWPFTFVAGLLVVYKIRRFPLVLTFGATAIVTNVLLFSYRHYPLVGSLKTALISSPLIFLGTIMLTEPATMPPRRNQQMAFGGIVGVLYASALQIGPFPIYPEIALLIGNLYAYIVAPVARVKLTLSRVEKISERVHNYVFTPNRAWRFIPGQYMEWTMANVPYDSRGNRRSFTIASSPTEEAVQLGVKLYEPSSTFKATLAKMKPGESLYASQLSGNFTLPNDPTQKLVFIAGGIGITPFRSMIKYLSDMNQKRDITLIYVVNNPTEFAYKEVFAEARRVGVTFLPMVSDQKAAGRDYRYGRLDTATIAELIPDYAERSFYISGPNVMVDATKKTLRQLEVPNTLITTDHFSGY